jgi:hypothetical protein
MLVHPKEEQSGQSGNFKHAALKITARCTLLRNRLADFHHPWCKKMWPKKSYVKEALQRRGDVLLSGPFKKFQKKFRALCITAFYPMTAPRI